MPLQIPVMLLVFSNRPLVKEAEMSNGAGGPFIQVAAFCERVLQEQDGVLSAIRIIDRIIQTVQAAGTQAPDQMPQLKFDMFVVVCFKSGDFRGKKDVKIIPKSPSGQILQGFSAPMLFEGDERGVNVVLRYSLDIKEEGLYWFDVELDGEVVTKMPLRVIYQKLQMTSTAIATPVH